MTKITKISVFTGLVLIALGIGFFIAAGMGLKSITALIPTFTGLLILLCGLLARNEKRRMMAAHIAVLLAGAGAVGALIRGIPLASSWAELEMENKRAAVAQLSMAAICLLYVIACVRSFIAARRG